MADRPSAPIDVVAAIACAWNSCRTCCKRNDDHCCAQLPCDTPRNWDGLEPCHRCHKDTPYPWFSAILHNTLAKSQEYYVEKCWNAIWLVHSMNSKIHTPCDATCIFKFDWCKKVLLQTLQGNFCSSCTILACSSYSCFDSNCLSHFSQWIVLLKPSDVAANIFCSAFCVSTLSRDDCASALTPTGSELCRIVFWWNSRFSLLSKTSLHCAHSCVLTPLWKFLKNIIAQRHNMLDIPEAYV